MQGQREAVGFVLVIEQAAQIQNLADGLDFAYTSCDAPHDNEVYHVVEYSEGPYPGDEAIEADISNACYEAFGAYVGRDYESSALDYVYFWPYEDRWNAGLRFGGCFLYDLEGAPLTGSASQSGW